MKIKKEPGEVYKEYQKDVDYKASLSLYETVKRNNNFYNDKQWEGVNAPDLDKPVFNVLKPAVNYFISMLVSDDIGVSLEMDNEIDTDVARSIENIIKAEIDKVFEQNRFNYLTRQFLKSCAIDGDACFYVNFNPSVNTGQVYRGAIDLELVDNVNVIFGDPSHNHVEKQPYIIIAMRKLTEEVREEAKANGASNWEDIKPDSQGYDEVNEDKLSDRYTTVLLKFWKENETVKFLKCTETVLIKAETDLWISLYPVAYMSWEGVKNSCHGVSPITGRIQNQIFVNKIYAMAMEHQKKMAFPKILYNATVIPNYSNRVGEAIAVNGDPREAIFSNFQASNMSDQALNVADSTIQKTKDSLGVFDAALGNVKPDNTSAIVAVQRASSQPLELQRMDYYQTVEDVVRIIVEFMASFYGMRYVSNRDGEGNKQIDLFDFSQLDTVNMRLKVEIGASSYWSELMQVQTLDNLMERQIIPDAITYLENMPNGYIKNKQAIIDKIKQMQNAQQMQQQGVMAGMQMPVQGVM